MSGWSSDHLCAIASLATARAGLAFPDSRIGTAEATIRRAMTREGVLDAALYLELVTKNAQAFEALLAELTVGETYFFRQRAHFDLIRTHILPDLRQRLGARHIVRVWSAGSASGEEAYTLAITLTEANVDGQGSTCLYQ